MRAGVADGAIWLAVTGMLLIDSWRNPVPWELVGGLVVVTFVRGRYRRADAGRTSQIVQSGR